MSFFTCRIINEGSYASAPVWAIFVSAAGTILTQDLGSDKVKQVHSKPGHGSQRWSGYPWTNYTDHDDGRDDDDKNDDDDVDDGYGDDATMITKK
ncbi:hypothetical protein PoB_007207600 [Plakobranchus ocellatus]|uniref:Uncharacterized protein n=1 Tax=Plakobranchus ocellatus TaxID=259542 RepID=A0AAV4DNY0_9GAST|nr:hypothetical protein PoB_007207600 [Plakobranchus ocellatus]